MERTIAIPQGWGNSTARREEWSKCVARYAALCSKPGMCVGDGDEDLPGKSTPTSSGALDHLASIATEELLRRRSKRKRSIIDRPLGEAPVPVVERVLNHWLTGLFRTASGETMAESLFAPDAFVSIELSIEGAPRRPPCRGSKSRASSTFSCGTAPSSPSTTRARTSSTTCSRTSTARSRSRSDPAQRRAAHGRPGGDHAPALGGHRRRPRPLLPALLCGLADASSCAWVSPLSRRALERVRGSFGEDAPLARASWSAEEGDGGAGGGGVGGGPGGGTGGDP
ncbi:hypothetical protein EMIHUDRAFT_442673 [Emiliania huxleyi CCMP1516]|uniref:Uncharacterized protein n=2 Tax=Emiliania huxleyi TaxID=2903 RepID=A0A0D3K1Z5_EMIH1|nr:hypothetical protein EMIHUDRAFT_442673 [Emiliania huxleyi CCMP1516]EOD29780.1 hypothetical protein EMIHUDRAFT_442673 [Emiliania huxleyi CCMP1516]|eukprot:XP_005782209.1 hypothetical protein EMIHUDRAFT_442673 [Emiliania huxleyi CCMP1516]